jgi:methyl-accepting chemotaxis protein
MTEDKAGLLDIMGTGEHPLGLRTQEAQAVLVLDAEVKKLVASREAIQPWVIEATDEISRTYRQASDDIAAARTATTARLVGSFGIVAFLMATGAFLVGIGITRLADVMQRLAHGDNAVQVPDTDRHDEVGAMARSVKVFKDNALKIEEIRGAEDATKQQAERGKRRALADIANSFEHSVLGIVGVLSSAATELQSRAQAMSSTAEQPESRSLSSRLAVLAASCCARSAMRCSSVWFSAAVPARSVASPRPRVGSSGKG